jgi:hypothetical protein
LRVQSVVELLGRSCNDPAAAPTPAAPLAPVLTTKYATISPFWASRAKALIVNWIPHCVAQCRVVRYPWHSVPCCVGNLACESAAA